MDNIITEKYTFRQVRLFLLLIFGIALTARLLYLRESVETPYFAIPYLDELYHYQWAKKIAQCQLLNERVFFRAPLYAYLLGAKFFLLGDDFLTTKLLQHLLGVITTLLIFVMSFLLFGGGFITTKDQITQKTSSVSQHSVKLSPALISATISAVIYALYAPVIFFEGELLDIFLSLFFYPLILSALLYERQSGWRKSIVFLIGLMLGLTAISRPNVLVFIPFIILYIFYYLSRHNIKRKIFYLSLILLCGIVLPIMPVTLHNAIVGHCFVPISSYGGINFYIGNNSTADGFTPKTTRQYIMTGEYQDSVELFARKEAALLLGYEPKATEINAYWRYRAWQEIAKSPQRFFQLMWKKFVLFWNAFEIKNNKSLYVVTEFTPWLRFVWNIFNFGAVIPLALTGLALAFICLLYTS
ncbi:MAG: glycosyltransferase family 39 protein, partial [Candidatus Sumerlaeia bacterium]|nr:glycosyltransferase family 39 protein [Candidatus Sumerlaeia bacterium]